MSTPLQGLLNLKRWEEDEAKARFAMRLKDLSTAEAELRDMEDSFTDTGLKMEEAARNETTMQQMAAFQAYLSFLLDAIHRGERAVKLKEAAVEAARKELLEAARERKTFERLEEKRAAEVEKEQLRKERILSDEHASMRYGGQKE